MRFIGSRRVLLSGLPRRSLPSLPIAAGAKVMAFGHSFIANGYFTGSGDAVNINNFTSLMLGELTWVRALDPRFNIDSWIDTTAPNTASAGLATAITGSMQGIGGDQLIYSATTKPGGLPREPYMAARQPDIIYLVFGVNDVIFGGYSDATPIIALYDQMLTLLRGAGIWVVAATIAPVGSAYLADGDPRLAIIQDFNTWLKGQQTAGREGLKVLDVEAVLGVGRPSQSYWLQTDGLHLQERGAYATGQALLTILQTMVSTGSYYNLDYTQSNLMPLATLAGTGGSKSNITGDVASSCNAARSVGTSTIAASKTTIGSGPYEKQVFTVTPVNDGTTVHMLQFQQNSNVTLSSLGIAAGDWVQMMQRIELSAWDGWVRAYPTLLLGQGGTNRFTHTVMRNNSSAGTYILPTGGLDFWAISDPVQISSALSINTLRASGGNFHLSAAWLSTVSGTGTVKVSTPILRRVVDPRPAWKL